jgi:AraC-like DNA-binding protein
MTRQVVAWLRAVERPARVRQTAFLEEAGISQMTLWRRLNAEGTSWPLLVDAELRRRMSVLMFFQASGQDMAVALGYSHRDCFYAAFRRIYGMSWRMATGRRWAA